jgi:hypothetical protein
MHAPLARLLSDIGGTSHRSALSAYLRCLPACAPGLVLGLSLLTPPATVHVSPACRTAVKPEPHYAMPDLQRWAAAAQAGN